MLLEVFLSYLTVHATQCDLDNPILSKEPLVKNALFDPFLLLTKFQTVCLIHALQASLMNLVGQRILIPYLCLYFILKNMIYGAREK